MKEKIKEFIIKYKIPLIIIGVLIVVVIIWIMNSNSKPTDNSETAKLARCLKNKGVKFYGASWCPHCNNQKQMFGDDAKLLPYIECSNLDRTTKKQCSDANITGYPTWIFADGKRQGGEIKLEQLKQMAGC